MIKLSMKDLGGNSPKSFCYEISKVKFSLFNKMSLRGSNLGLEESK